MTRAPGLVSVIVPVYNGAAHLRHAIDSALAQAYPSVEVIAVDDGSTDDSAELLDQYGDRISFVRQPNAGVAAARNAGIERARGEFIAFLDQDDSWRPEKIQRQVDVFRSDDRCGLVHTAVAYFDGSRRRLVPPPNPLARPCEMTGSCFEPLLLGNPICNSSVMVRGAVLDRVGNCDPQILGNTCQDYDLWLRIARVTAFGFVNEQLTVFRLHPGQGHKDRPAMLTEELEMLLRIRSRAEWRVSPEGRRRLADLYDELATAHFDAHDPSPARRYFAQAAIVGRGIRRWLRFGASCLPHRLAIIGRRCAWNLRRFVERRAAAASDEVAGSCRLA